MSSNRNNQGYTSWNSDPFQRASPAQGESLTQYPYPQDMQSNQNNVASSNSQGRTYSYNPAQHPDPFNVASSPNHPLGIPRALSQPYSHPQHRPQRHEREDFAIDSRPDPHLDALRRAMMDSITPPSSPPPTHATPNNRSSTSSSTPNSEPYQTTSLTSKAFSFVKGLTPLKATLARKFPDARYGVIDKLNELGVRWSEENGTAQIYCEHGVTGTADYVAYLVRWHINGAAGGAPALPGGYNWFTKIEIVKTKGSGSRFRELGTKTLDAAKYKARGGVMLDYSITTWGLY